MKINPKEIALVEEKRKWFLPGHRLCAGCAAPIIVRQVFMALDKKPIVVTATGCLEVATTIYPYTSWRVPWIHNAFENNSATASGIEAAIKALRRKGEIHEESPIIVFGGDGATYDIGFQALSGAIERGHNFLYILYDNEAYMNTGIQRSGGTPGYAWTTTTPVGKKLKGKTQWKKPIARIVAAHRQIKYVATASPAYWTDLIKKVRKGVQANGPAFIHTFSTCPRGWRTAETKISIKIARLAVQTCYFPLWEYENGQYRLTSSSEAIAKVSKRKIPIEEFLKPQARFRHLFHPEKDQKIIKCIQNEVDKEWSILLKLTGHQLL